MREPTTAWQLEARRLHDEKGGDYETVRRAVALFWLEKGDTRPVQELLFAGEPLGEVLSRFLAGMMDPDWHAIPKELLAFELKAVRRDSKAGRPVDQERVFLKDELADRVKAYMETGVAYEGAIASVIEDFPGVGIGRETLRKAYNERHGRKAKGRK